MIETIVSGGQTGVDQAALDWAINHDVTHGGWCPKGRLAEDGTIPDRFLLKETPRSVMSQRTEWNVRDADGTVLFTTEPDLTGGTRTTWRYAQRLGKPILHLCPALPVDPSDEENFALSAKMAGNELQEFIEDHNLVTLNVAGPRKSNDPAAIFWTQAVLDAALNAA